MTHIFLPFLSNQIARIKKRIAEGRFIVNKSKEFESKNTGSINIDPNHPAEILQNHPDKTNKAPLSNRYFMLFFQKNQSPWEWSFYLFYPKVFFNKFCKFIFTPMVNMSYLIIILLYTFSSYKCT